MKIVNSFPVEVSEAYSVDVNGWNFTLIYGQRNGKELFNMKRHAELKRGTIYTNKGGGKFLCTSDTCNDITYFENVVSGWRRTC